MTGMPATGDRAGCAVTSPEFATALVSAVPSLRRGVEAVVRDPWLREDVVQEALRRAWCSRSSFDPTRPMGPWLWRLAMVSLKDFTSRHSVPIDGSAFVSTAAADDLPGSDEHLAVLDRCRAVQSALDALSPDERVLLWRRDVERLPYEMLASLGASASARGVRTAVWRARRRLRVAYLAVADSGNGRLAGFSVLLGRWRARLAQRVEPVLDRLAPLVTVPAALAAATVVVVAVPGTVVLRSDSSERVVLASTRPERVTGSPTSSSHDDTSSVVPTRAPTPPARVPARTASGDPGGARSVPSPAVVRAGASGAAVANGEEQRTPVTPETDAIWYQNVEVRCDRSVVLSSACAVLRATPLGDGFHLTTLTEPGP